jgi:hypothetical protein
MAFIISGIADIPKPSRILRLDVRRSNPGPRHRDGILWNSEFVDFEPEGSKTSWGVI